MLDARTNLSTEVLREIDSHFGPLLTKARIRNNVKLAEAPSFGRTIFEHAPDSNGARDYEAFADEFLAKIGMAGAPSDAPSTSEGTNGSASENGTASATSAAPAIEEPPPLAADASA